MFDRSLVTSGFDTETLISEKYLSYLLLAQIEAGLLRLQFDVVDVPTNTNLSVTLHPPFEEGYETLYPQSNDPPLPDRTLNTFVCKLLPGEASAFVDVAFAQNGTRLLTRSVDDMVRVWDLDSRTQDEAAAFAVNPAIGSAFNAAGTQIATASSDHDVRIWDLASQSVVMTLSGHIGIVECVAFSPDGTRLVSGSFDQTARVWDLTTGMPLLTLTGHVGRVISVAFNNAGTQIATAGEDGTVRLWDAQSGAPGAMHNSHTGPVNCVAFSPNDSRVASGSDDRTVKLWDPNAIIVTNAMRTFTGHQDAVLWVDVGVNGTRLLSGSRDQTLKLWSSTSSSSLRSISEHRSPVVRVRFGDANGLNASVSSGGSIRLWEDITSPDTIEIRMDFMRVSVMVTVDDHVSGESFQGPLALIVYLALNSQRTAAGLERNHTLRLSFGRLDPLTRQLLEARGVDTELVESTIRRELDRDLPLGVAQGQSVQQIRMRKFFDADGSGTLGIYVDLALRSAPGDVFRPPRGESLLVAQNFREAGTHIAFATSPGLFAMLGPDAKFQRAELAPGSTNYRYPLREDMTDTSSKEFGTISSITVRGRRIVPPGTFIGQLEMKVDGDYTDTSPDVGFTAHFYFNPKRDAGGIVDWESEVDVDFGLLATVLFIFAGLVVTVAFLAPVGITFWLVVGTMVSLAGQQLGEHFASKRLAESADEDAQASVLDSLPFRLPAAVRRWDPFYLTQHQIVARLDEPMVIDDAGIAFTGVDLVLDKQPVLQDDVAPYDEVRGNLGKITGIRYEVPDFVAQQSSIEAKGPGVDRMDFTRDDPLNEPRLVTLALEQIDERKAAQRILAPIVLDARRINMFGGQIDQLLCTTWRIRTQQRNRVLGEWEQQERADIAANELAGIEQDATDDLTQELGHAPSAEELAAEVELRIQSLIADRRKIYEDGALRDDLHEALAPLLHFDVLPDELITLQERGVFTLEGKEIIVRHNENGTVTPYYRDRPDGDPRDNLLALPHYSTPYVPPP